MSAQAPIDQVGAAGAARAEGAERSRGLAAARPAEEHAAAARLDVLGAHLRRRQLPRLRAEAGQRRPRAAARARAERARRARRRQRPSAQRRHARGPAGAAARESRRAEPPRARRRATASHSREPQQVDLNPPPGGEPRAADGIRAVRRIFQSAPNPPRFPMYVRQAKQFMRSVDPTVRRAQVRVRHAAGSAARLPAGGPVPHRARPAGRDSPVPRQHHAAVDRRGRSRGRTICSRDVDRGAGCRERAGMGARRGAGGRGRIPAGRLDAAATRRAGEEPPAEVVDGDVVQEMDVQQVVDGEEAPSARRASRSAAAGTRKRAAQPRAAKKTEAAAPRARKTAAKSPRAPRARKTPADVAACRGRS